MSHNFKIDGARRRAYGTRNPLSDNQKQYVQDNHKRQSPKEMADNLSIEKSRVVGYMRYARLATSNEVHGSKDARLNENHVKGCFNVHARGNWLM